MHLSPDKLSFWEKFSVDLVLVLDVVFVLIFLLYSMYLSLKARKIKNSYNEGKFIFISLINQSQLLVVGGAVLVQLSQLQNTSSFVLAMICIVGFSNLSTLGLIFVPKLLVLYYPDRRTSMHDHRSKKAKARIR